MKQTTNVVHAILIHRVVIALQKERMKIMNSVEVAELHAGIRTKILLCTAEQQLFFKRMYSHRNLEKDILEVVDALPIEKLKRALSQIENTLKKQS